MNHDDIKNRFTYHKPDATTVEHMQRIRREAKSLAYNIDKLCPDGERRGCNCGCLAILAVTLAIDTLVGIGSYHLALMLIG